MPNTSLYSVSIVMMLTDEPNGAQLFVSCHFLALFNAYRPHVGIGGYIFAVSHENVVFVRDAVALDFDDLSVVDRNDVRTLGPEISAMFSL